MGPMGRQKKADSVSGVLGDKARARGSGLSCRVTNPGLHLFRPLGLV